MLLPLLDEWIDIICACRRSRVKLRVYDAVVLRRVATVPELADIAKTTPDRVMLVLHGDGRLYRRETSLVALGVVEERATDAGPAYAVTTRGLRAHAEVHERLAR